MEELLHVERQFAEEAGLAMIRAALSHHGAQPRNFEGVRVHMGDYLPENSRILAFRSEWGREFSPQWYDGARALSVGSAQGRSSHGYSPFLYILQEDGTACCAAVCWSGNWRVEFDGNGGVDFVLPPEMFRGTLEPGESIELPTLLFGTNPGGMDALCGGIADWLETNWMPPSRIPVPTAEWNHWWTYEDVEINETVFLENARAAKQLGVTLCTLDAGWFGNPDADDHWTQCRGDWDCVNHKRFPHGLRWLSEQIHSMDMLFGIWIEPEAPGARSALIRQHPEWSPFVCDEGKAPYLCLASDGAAEWLYQTLDRLVQETSCDWIKLDFNVDPGLGCKRNDHGHQEGLGMFFHVKNYYRVLDRLREKYPKLILENCSSGGLRFDLEMFRHTDVSFLSDPDELPHSQQCVWGASRLVYPHRLLHWAPSQTRRYPDGSHVFPSFEITEETPEFLIRGSLRNAMPHQLGVCRDLTSLPEHARNIFADEIGWYRETVAPLLSEGHLEALTSQPMRWGERTDDERMLADAPEAFAAERLSAFLLRAEHRAVVWVCDAAQTGKEAVCLKLPLSETGWRCAEIRGAAEIAVSGGSFELRAETVPGQAVVAVFDRIV